MAHPDQPRTGDQPTIQPACQRAELAFTLIELLLAVVIIGIAAVMVVPVFKETDSVRLTAAARMLVADIGFARVESISHTRNYGLKFDSSNNSYSVVQSISSDSFDCNSATVVTNPVDQAPFTTTFPVVADPDRHQTGGRGAAMPGVSIASYSLDGDQCLAFGRYGELDQTHAAYVVLSAGGSAIRITIDPISGEAVANLVP